MKMRNLSKNALAVAVGAGLVAAPVLSAQAYEFAISGHINRTIVQLDNGDEDGIFHADNDSSSSRIRFVGSGDYGAGKAGFTMEHQFESNTTAGLDLPNVAGGAGDNDSIRKVEGWFSGDWGKISIGQGSDALDGVTEFDLGGTFNAGVYAFPVDMMAGVTFVTSAGARNTAGTNVSAAITTFDGGRRDRIRYDSPSLGGALSFAVSHAEGDQIDAHVAGNHEFGQSQFTWAIGFRDQGDAGGTALSGGAIVADDVDPSTTAASASLLIGNWVFVVSISDRDKDSPATLVGQQEDPESTYAKVGYKTAGGHNLAVGVGTYDDIALDGDEADLVQFGWEKAMNKSVILYASWTEAELDRPSQPNLEDVTALQFGTKILFK
ncbi:MAG: porin [Hyphomicrobium sp.]